MEGSLSEMLERKDLIAVDTAPSHLIREVEILKTILVSAMATCEALEVGLRNLESLARQKNGVKSESMEPQTFGS